MKQIVSLISAIIVSGFVMSCSNHLFSQQNSRLTPAICRRIKRDMVFYQNTPTNNAHWATSGQQSRLQQSYEENNCAQYQDNAKSSS